MTEPNGFLIHNLLLFGRLLHGLGFDVSTARMIDVIRALEFVEIGRKADFYFAIRSLLVQHRQDLALFDEAFEAFWRKPQEGWTSLDLQAVGERSRKRQLRFTPPPLRPASEESPGFNNHRAHALDKPPLIQTTYTYSDREILRHKDFAEMTGEEIEAIQRMIPELVWRLDTRRSRRQKPGSGEQLDLRRTLRRNLKYGGEILTLARRHPKDKPRPVVIIADISGSMERYTRLMLNFIYCLSEGLQQRVESFVFSTRLTRISRQVQGNDVDFVLAQVARLVPDWSGGTRIGEALKRFNFEWGRRVLGQGAVVLLISDGWDRGDADVLRQEIARLQRSCYRLIWLNPLLGSQDYEPLTRGMRTALPYVDDFLPVHNLGSLEDLVRHLNLVDKNRPVRRQFQGKTHERRSI